VLDDWHAYCRDSKELVSADATHAFVLHSCEAWLERRMATFTRIEIEDLLRRKRDRGTKSAANRLHSHLKTLFNWAEEDQGLTVNPAAKVKRPWQVHKKKTRRNYPWFKGEAADNVIRSLWQFADSLTTKGKRDRALFIRLLLITGKRCNAVHDMSWEHIDASWWWSPPYRSEYKRNDPIPLPVRAQRVLGERRERGRIIAPFLRNWLQKQARRRKGMPADFVWHGVRHVVITKLRELGVQRHVVKLLTDHKEDDVHADYEHDLPRKEMLAALELWCAHLETLVAPAEGVAVLR
jgi:integrase